MKQMLIFLIVFSSSCIDAQELNEIKTETSITFKIKNLGVNVDGSFLKVEIGAHIDENDLAKSFINSEIMVNSIETGLESRDAHILKEDF